MRFSPGCECCESCCSQCLFTAMVSRYTFYIDPDGGFTDGGNQAYQHLNGYWLIPYFPSQDSCAYFGQDYAVREIEGLWPDMPNGWVVRLDYQPKPFPFDPDGPRQWRMIFTNFFPDAGGQVYIVYKFPEGTTSPPGDCAENSRNADGEFIWQCMGPNTLYIDWEESLNVQAATVPLCIELDGIGGAISTTTCNYSVPGECNWRGFFNLGWWYPDVPDTFTVQGVTGIINVPEDFEPPPPPPGQTFSDWLEDPPDPPPTGPWSCIDGTCEPDPLGPYLTLAECIANCEGPGGGFEPPCENCDAANGTHLITRDESQICLWHGEEILHCNGGTIDPPHPGDNILWYLVTAFPSGPIVGLREGFWGLCLIFPDVNQMVWQCSPNRFQVTDPGSPNRMWARIDPFTGQQGGEGTADGTCAVFPQYIDIFPGVL